MNGTRGQRPPLNEALRLLVITDARLAAPHPVSEVVCLALRAGARAIQLRDKEASPRALFAEAVALLEITREAGAYLFVNDRLDVALAAGADGAHLGPDDLPIEAARRWAPTPFLLGTSTDEPSAARAAEASGADYIGCGSVYPTTTKDVGSEAIGVARLAQVARAVSIPVVGIGGVTPARAPEVARTGAAGVAVVAAVMGAEEPTRAVRELLSAFEARG